MAGPAAPAPGPGRAGTRTVAWAVLVAVVAPAVAWAWARDGRGVPPLPWPELAWRLGAYAVLEELAFRGAVQPWLARRPALAGRAWAGLSAANLLTSLAFAAAHATVQPPWQAAAMLPVSLVLGLALEQSGRLAAPVALHLYFNLLLWGASLLSSAMPR